MVTRTKRKRGGATYRCPRDGTPTRVLRTLLVDDSIVRRRVCPKCKRQYRTEERRIKR